ncbi:ATPase [Rhodonellum psychrophilum GCM71 = DSM 17998]|uniref:ATPase n=2 Tax=Rhodonellum TaxID=336827 RepID=U5BLQ1_9BACT|nr:MULTISPECIES: ATP-grasp domain-containing protein [Rhodonellum]ERM81400.1 ATPase [Rhodonellum psychrophilum GCM71 = DSM 17998]MDO9554695.1 ATP-grasp domain-containing protein [Rhodonellum sp.]SDZ56676.1 ATP-grasp domain-containing protein [Rhodonellum ikkaensis]
MAETAKTFICVSNFFKGGAFLTELKKLGNKVYLITSENLRDKPWPFAYIDEIFYMPGQDLDWNMDHLLLGVANLMKSNKVESIVALDDYDVEKATFLRENLRIPGMGQTTGRFFRDKLAMRMKAKSSGVLVPEFAALFNDDEINHFADTVPAPWVLKPRSEASANGIIKVEDKESLWHHIHALEENRIRYLVEQFKPGDVFHADGLNLEGKTLFCTVSRYLSTPMEISQGGGIFRSANLPYKSEDDKAINKANSEVMKAFGMKSGATHTEFIKSKEDGKIYFLETSSRVGGAHLAEMVEAATGVNLWEEWARIEDSLAKGYKYKLPKVRKDYAGIVLTLSKFEQPDLSEFNDPEVYFRVPLEYHAGLIVKAKTQERVLALLDDYAERLTTGFSSVAQQEQLKKFH